MDYKVANMDSMKNGLPSGFYIVQLLPGWKHSMARLVVDIEGEPKDKIDALFGGVLVFKDGERMPASWDVRLCPSPINKVVTEEAAVNFGLKLGALGLALGIELDGNLEKDADTINEVIREKGNNARLNVYGWGTVTPEGKRWFNIQRINNLSKEADKV